MCGIVGIVNFHHKISNDKYIIEDMKETIAKRGPDENGTYISDNVLLGHRRLIVIDPKGGSQPMIKKYENNEYVIVYNGELYNSDELRIDLINKGYDFNSYSDTEVLLTAYMCYGVNAIKKLNGIFAFAIYDKNKGQVFFRTN